MKAVRHAPTAPCKLATTGFESNNALMTLLASPYKVFYLEPTFSPEETCFLDPFVNTSNPVYAPTAEESQATAEPRCILWSDVNTWIDKATGESNGYFPGPYDTVEIPSPMTFLATLTFSKTEMKSATNSSAI